MKCVLLGDPLVPSKYMAGMLSQLESRDVELLQLDWKSDLTLADFVKVTRQMELTGPIDLPPQLLSTLIQADIVVTNHAPLSSLAIKSSSKLKLIASTRSGTENIDLVAAREKGITVVNSPGRNATAVADYTIGRESIRRCEAPADKSFFNSPVEQFVWFSRRNNNDVAFIELLFFAYTWKATNDSSASTVEYLVTRLMPWINCASFARHQN